MMKKKTPPVKAKYRIGQKVAFQSAEVPRVCGTAIVRYRQFEWHGEQWYYGLDTSGGSHFMMPEAEVFKMTDTVTDKNQLTILWLDEEE